MVKRLVIIATLAIVIILAIGIPMASATLLIKHSQTLIGGIPSSSMTVGRTGVTNPTLLVGIATAPVVVTNDASSIGATYATLNGLLTEDMGVACQYRFEYGYTTEYDQATTWTGSLHDSDPFSSQITSLDNLTTYHFMAECKAGSIIGYGADKSFVTGCDPADIDTLDATDILMTRVTLNAFISDDGGDLCKVHFQYGETTAYGYDTPWSGQIYNSEQYIAVVVSNLDVDTAYHFRAQVSNHAGVVNGDDKEFATLAGIGNVENFIITNITSSTASLSWTKAVGSTKTLIKYQTGGYPSDITSGMEAYFDVGSSCSISNLTSGTTYYLSAWGADTTSDTYSGIPANAMGTTSASFGGTWQTDPVDPQPSPNPDSSKLSGAPGYGLGVWVANQMHFSVTSFYLIMALILISLLTALIAVTTKSVGWTALSIIVMVAVCVAVGVIPMFAAYLLGIIILPLAVIKGIQTVS